MLSSPLGPTPTISQSMATARVSLETKDSLVTPLTGTISTAPLGDVTHPSEAVSLTSTFSTDSLDLVSSSRFLLAIFAASGPIAASISFGSTSSNQISGLVSTDLITFNSLKAVLHL